MANSIGASESLKLLCFPEARNQILIRLENLADLFDGAPAEDLTFDVYQYALEMYTQNNGGVAPASIDIVERTISNN